MGGKGREWQTRHTLRAERNANGEDAHGSHIKRRLRERETGCVIRTQSFGILARESGADFAPPGGRHHYHLPSRPGSILLHISHHRAQTR